MEGHFQMDDWKLLFHKPNDANLCDKRESKHQFCIF
jgi:hypothetical protein